MKQTPSSKSQNRAVKLFGLTASDSYSEMVATLEKIGISGSGIPVGHDWRSASKLSDEELKSLLTSDREYREDPDQVIDGFGGVQ